MKTCTLLLLCALPLSSLSACDPAEEVSDDWLEGAAVTPRCLVNGHHHVTGTLTLEGGEVPMGAGMTKASPSASYSSLSCGDYYVIQATGLNNFPLTWKYLTVTPFWAGAPLTASQCVWTVLHHDISIYYDGAWHQREAYFDTGHWDGSKCVIGERIEVYDPNVEAERIQVAVRALYLDGSGEHYGKVGATIFKGMYILNPG